MVHNFFEWEIYVSEHNLHTHVLFKPVPIGKEVWRWIFDVATSFNFESTILWNVKILEILDVPFIISRNSLRNVSLSTCQYEFYRNSHPVVEGW